MKDMGKKYEPNNPSFSIEQLSTLLQFQKLEEDLQQPEKKEELVCYCYDLIATIEISKLKIRNIYVIKNC